MAQWHMILKFMAQAHIVIGLQIFILKNNFILNFSIQILI